MMIRKLWIILLAVTFVLGSVSTFWSKPALANTEEERKVCVCVAEPWSGGEWNKSTPPPSSDHNSNCSSADPAKLGDKLEGQRVRQRPQRSFWSRFQLFLLNIKLIFGGK
jgi:hypothetical protein